MSAKQLLVIAIAALVATTVAIARVGCQMIEDPNLTFHQETVTSNCVLIIPEEPDEPSCANGCTKLVWEEPACKADEAPDSVAYCEGGIPEMFQADVSEGFCFIVVTEGEEPTCNCIPSPNGFQIQVAGTGIDAGFDEAGCGGTPGS